MNAINSGLNLYLLQRNNNVQYFKEDDPKSALILVILIAAIIIISIVVSIIRKGIGPGSTFSSKTGSAKKSGPAPRKFNSFTLYRIASSYGLDRDQAKLLEYVFRNDSVADPERVMRNPALLDRHFRRAYKTIERNSTSDEEVQQRLVELFSLRNTIEAAPGIGGASSSSGQIAENTPAVLGNGKDHYPVKVHLSRGQNIVVDIPRNALGTPVRLPKGLKVTLSFFTKSSKGFSFDGNIIGSVETSHGPGLHISHTGKMKSLVKRMYRRRQASLRCQFFLVFLEETGLRKKSAPKLIVDTKRFDGTIQDISIGGCSLKTNASIQIGSRLKITIDYNDDSHMSVLGQVLRVNRSGSIGAIVHIKFLKVPRRAFNSISSLVFGYDE
ncbi:MAG: PilZ domain-containing protein [Treponema sp.]|nr:PilZ domain-containing protein [Treponema sp.]